MTLIPVLWCQAGDGAQRGDQAERRQRGQEGAAQEQQQVPEALASQDQGQLHGGHHGAVPAQRQEQQQRRSLGSGSSHQHHRHGQASAQAQQRSMGEPLGGKSAERVAGVEDLAALEEKVAGVKSASGWCVMVICRAHVG